MGSFCKSCGTAWDKEAPGGKEEQGRKTAEASAEQVLERIFKQCTDEQRTIMLGDFPIHAVFRQ